MEMPAWTKDILAFSLTLSYLRQLGLAFLLGSFAVATWSDLKHLSAQREFREIWLLFLACVLAADCYDVWSRQSVAWQVPAVKWGLIFLFSLLSLERLPLPWKLFRLAPADAAALAEAVCLLTPILILILYFLAKMLSTLLGPLLRRGSFYPFMPVVSLATLGILLIAVFLPGMRGDPTGTP